MTDLVPLSHSVEDRQTCCIAFGGNLGNVLQTFRRAVDALSSHAGIRFMRGSEVYRTVPIGADAGNAYLNAAVLVECTLKAKELLKYLHQVEEQLGRVRTNRWGPRTLDLDLITYGDRLSDSETLRLPHPHAWYRRFVLDPVVDVVGELVHPFFGCRWTELRHRLLLRPLPVALQLRAESSELIQPIVAEFRDVRLLWTTEERRDLKKGGFIIDDASSPSEDADFNATKNSANAGSVPGVEQFRLVVSTCTDECVVQIRDILNAALDQPIAVGYRLSVP